MKKMKPSRINEKGYIKTLQGQICKMAKALDDIYNHNEAARVAVIQHYGLHHNFLVREAIASTTDPSTPDTKDSTTRIEPWDDISEPMAIDEFERGMTG